MTVYDAIRFLLLNKGKQLEVRSNGAARLLVQDQWQERADLTIDEPSIRAFIAAQSASGPVGHLGVKGMGYVKYEIGPNNTLHLWSISEAEYLRDCRPITTR